MCPAKFEQANRTQGRFTKYKKAMKNKLANPVPATAARRATSNASLGFAASPYSFRETISSSIQTRNNFRQDYQARRRSSVIFEDLNGAGKIEEVSSVTKKLRPQTRTKKKLGKPRLLFDLALKQILSRPVQTLDFNI